MTVSFARDQGFEEWTEGQWDQHTHLDRVRVACASRNRKRLQQTSVEFRS